METVFTNQNPLQYLKCQSCSAKVNCHECERSIIGSLQSRKGILRVEVRMDEKRLTIWYDSTMDENDILDALEDEGIFTD